MRKKRDTKSLALWIIAVCVVIITGILIVPPAFRHVRATMAEGTAAREQKAKARLSQIGLAQYSFNESKGRYGTIKELVDGGYLIIDKDSRFEGKLLVEHGYFFEVLLEISPITDSERFQCAAWPEESSFGKSGKSFWYSHYYMMAEEYSDAGLPPAGFGK
jgi:hypothetical protein